MPVVLLCHCDGTNGSTTFTDVSPSAHTITASGGAVVSTSQVKFGTGAVKYTTSGQLAVTGSLSDFDFQSAPFTIEAWAYLPANAAVAAIVAQFNNAPGGGWFFGSVTGNFLAFWYYNATPAQVQLTSSTTIPLNSWHHYAVDRDAGGTIRVYLDGAVVTSGSGPTFQAAAQQANIGNSIRTTDEWTNGWIDEVRIVKGQAMYGGAFTPPTGPFNGVAAAQSRAMVLA